MDDSPINDNIDENDNNDINRDNDQNGDNDDFSIHDDNDDFAMPHNNVDFAIPDENDDDNNDVNSEINTDDNEDDNDKEEEFVLSFSDNESDFEDDESNHDENGEETEKFLFDQALRNMRANWDVLERKMGKNAKLCEENANVLEALSDKQFCDTVEHFLKCQVEHNLSEIAIRKLLSGLPEVKNSQAYQTVFNSEYLSRKLYKQIQNQQSQTIETKYVSKNDISNTFTTYRVSIDSVCKKFLEQNPLKNESATTSATTISSYKDSQMAQRSMNKLTLELYFDDVTLTNSTNKAQKFCFMFVGFMNKDFKERCHRNDLVTILALNRQEMKKHSISLFECLYPVRLELAKLLRSGLNIDGKRVEVTIGNLLGDNLAINEILGLKMAFQRSSFICRFCGEDSVEIQRPKSSKIFQKSNQKLLNHTVRPFFLHGLLEENISRISPPDIMHDILEGCLMDWLKLIFDFFIFKSTSENEARRKIVARFENFKARFAYGTSSLSFEKDVIKFIGTAVQVRVIVFKQVFLFLKLLLFFLLENRIVHEDEHYFYRFF